MIRARVPQPKKKTAPRPVRRKWKTRRAIAKHDTKIECAVRISPTTYERVVAVAVAEGRTFPEAAGVLIMLGAGVWRRLRERPEISKTFIYENKAELLLLADLQLTQELLALQQAEADAVIRRDRYRRELELSERSKYY
jgi:hypothetical protein